MGAVTPSACPAPAPLQHRRRYTPARSAVVSVVVHLGAPQRVAARECGQSGPHLEPLVRAVACPRVLGWAPRLGLLQRGFFLTSSCTAGLAGGGRGRGTTFRQAWRCKKREIVVFWMGWPTCSSNARWISPRGGSSPADARLRRKARSWISPSSVK